MILFFDTETTGFVNGKISVNDPKQARVVQLGAMLVDDQAEGRPEIMRLDTILDVGDVYFDEGAVKTHGISKDFARSFGVNEGAAFDIFMNMLEVCDLCVAHNTAFDTKVIRTQMQRLTATPDYDPFAQKPSYCTMQALTPILKLPNKSKPGFGWPKLEKAVEICLGREATNAHNAIGDVIDCRDLFFWIVDQRQQEAE